MNKPPPPLFPSAAGSSSTNIPANNDLDKTNTRSWLTNSSYQPPVAPQTPSSPTPDLPPPPTKKSKREDKQKEKGGKKAAVIKPDTNWLEDCSLPPQEAYRLDPKSDRANLQYNALYSGDIASYRRRFGGLCLGLAPGHLMEWTDNRGSKLPRKKKENVSRYFNSALPQNESCLYLGTEKDEVLGAAPRPTHAPFYMSLEPSSSARDNDSSKTEGVEVEEEEEEDTRKEFTEEVFLSQKTASYNRTLQADPHNVKLWLEFLEFRPSLRTSVRKGGAEGVETSKAIRALNERKLAIFERALEHNPKSEELLVGHLELLREMDQEPQAMMKRWRDVVFRMPNKPLLWLKYTEFTRAQFSTFSLSSLTTLYHKSMTTLTLIIEGVMKSHRLEEGTADHLLALFAQFCHCLSAAGQNERAIACYQALIEFNLCTPPDISSTVKTSKEKVAFFEPFWDSGAPRLGEAGAVGWARWMQASQRQHVTVSPLSFIDTHFLESSSWSNSTQQGTEENDPELEMITGCSLPEAWLRLEAHRQVNNPLPFHGSEDELSDPERAVLFEDVSQSLFTLSDPDLCLRLVLQYLQFLGVDLSHSGAPCLDSLPNLLSTHLHCTNCSSASSFSSSHSSLRGTTSFDGSYSLYRHRICGVGSGYQSLSTEGLLESRWSHSPSSPSMSAFITNTCNQVLSLIPSLEHQTVLAVEWVRFELSQLAPILQDPIRRKAKETRGKMKVVQKLVKSLLRHESHRNNLVLWDTCGQLEYLVGGVQEAQALYESVLSQYVSINPSLFPLYQHYCEILVGLAQNFSGTSSTEHNLSRALQLTMCVAEGKYNKLAQSTPLPGALLKARHLFERNALSGSLSYQLCWVYFEYLSRGVQPACKVFEKITSARGTLLPASYSSSSSSASSSYSLSSDDKKLKTVKAELHYLYHHQVILLLLSHSSSFKPMPPTFLWNLLERALTLFPDDPFFLSSYTDSQQPLYLMGKLRKYFDTHAPRAKTALPWIHAVRAEIARYKRVMEGEMEGSTDVPSGLVNRIRALLNRAIQSVNGRGCPLLWRLAMSFEVEQGRMTEAMALFYQAIQYCPGLKVLYWDTVHHFPDQLERVVEVMEERELRIRAPLEEVQMLLDATNTETMMS